jgi:endonuclease YncB( thermonuclease family)
MIQIVRWLLFSVLLLVLLLLFAAHSQVSASIKIDLTGKVNNIVDGDTFDVVVANSTQYRIRLADLNASERGQVGYQEAKDYLKLLIYEKQVYLDVDDFYIWDAHGRGNRLVCVTYVEYNSTHSLNVNEALIETGQVEEKNYDNEFNPAMWTLYIHKDAIPEIPSELILIPLIVLIPITALYIRRK